MKTMSETYGEPNDRYGKHLCCPKCGLCITCGDCKCEKGEQKKLKTLKDLGLRNEQRVMKSGHWYLDGNELKEEAIKWVKHWIKLLPKDSYENLKIDLNKIGKPSDYMKIGQIKGFLDFFNIIKSDLK